MGAEVVTLTHADAPQRGNATHNAPHPALRLSHFTINTYEIILKVNLA
jgi:hypothetical protein